MTENKKEWVEPELIVLVRSKPEEAVLTVCKGDSSHWDFNNLHNGCTQSTTLGVCATYCNTQASS